MGPEGGKALSSLYAYGRHWILASRRHTVFGVHGAVLLSLVSLRAT